MRGCMRKLVDLMLKDPRAMTLEHTERQVTDPMGTCYDHVRAAIHDAYEDMGGQEEDDVGARSGTSGRL